MTDAWKTIYRHPRTGELQLRRPPIPAGRPRTEFIWGSLQTNDLDDQWRIAQRRPDGSRRVRLSGRGTLNGPRLQRALRAAGARGGRP